MIHTELFASLALHLYGELATGRIVRFFRRMDALQLLEVEWRPRASPEGPREAGIGQRRGCPAARTVRGRSHPATGSHLPAEGTALPCAVAFRVIAPCPAPQKSHTPPSPTTGFRLKRLVALFLILLLSAPLRAETPVAQLGVSGHLLNVEIAH